jgi:hypothetical protein
MVGLGPAATMMAPGWWWWVGPGGRAGGKSEKRISATTPWSRRGPMVTPFCPSIRKIEHFMFFDAFARISSLFNVLILYDVHFVWFSNNFMFFKDLL